MSSFECKVSELNDIKEANSLKNDKYDKKDVKLSPGAANISSFETNTAQSKTIQSNSINSMDKILSEKNLKSVLLITVVYFLLHTDQVLEFVNDKIPSLGSNMALNSVGKIIFGLLIGIFFIIYSFFFQAP